MLWFTPGEALILQYSTHRHTAIATTTSLKLLRIDRKDLKSVLHPTDAARLRERLQARDDERLARLRQAAWVGGAALQATLELRAWQAGLSEKLHDGLAVLRQRSPRGGRSGGMREERVDAAGGVGGARGSGTGKVGRGYRGGGRGKEGAR